MNKEKEIAVQRAKRYVDRFPRFSFDYVRFNQNVVISIEMRQDILEVVIPLKRLMETDTVIEGVMQKHLEDLSHKIRESKYRTDGDVIHNEIDPAKTENYTEESEEETDESDQILNDNEYKRSIASIDEALDS